MLTEYPRTIQRIPEQYKQALDMLLLPVIGTRQIGKKGIQIGGRTYIAPEFGRPDVMQQAAEIRFDATRPQYAYVYLDGLFVCRAECVDSMEPEQRRKIAVDARHTMRSVRTAIAGIRKDARKNHLDRMAQDILDMHVERALRLVEDNPAPTADVIEHVTFELAEAARAASKDLSMQTLTPDQAEQARTAAVKILEDQATSFVAPANLAEKQALYLRLDARRLRGEALTPDESNWMEAFGRSYEWESVQEAARICAAMNQ